MITIHPKKISRLIAPSAMVLSLLLPFESQAGFQWITPLEQTPLATQPTPAEKTPVNPKKEPPPPVQLPALEPVNVAPPEAVAPAQQPSPAPTDAAPVVLTPTVVDHEAAAAATGQPAMDVVAPGAVPAPVVEPVKPVPAAEVEPVQPVVESAAAQPDSVAPQPAPVALPEPEAPPQPKAEAVEPPLTVMPHAPEGSVTAAPPSPPAVVAEPVPAPPSPAVVAAPVVTPVVAPKQEAAAVPDDGAVVKGFGKDLPLVLVLKQIVPKDHVFAFESGVDPSTRVSWKGGKGWRAVLNDTLRPVGLTAHEESKLVSIIRSQAGAAEPVAPVAVAPAMATPSTTTPVVLAQPEPVAPLPAVVEPVKEAASAAATVEPVALPEAVPPASAVPVTGKIVMPPATLEPPLLPGLSDVWKAEAGEHLRAVIRRWCERAKVELVWSSEYDYPIQAGVSLTGSFEEAVRSLLSGFVDAKPQPFARLHDNPAAGQRTLVVQSRGNTNGE